MYERAAHVCKTPPERCVFVHLDPVDCRDVVGLSSDHDLNIYSSSECVYMSSVDEYSTDSLL